MSLLAGLGAVASSVGSNMLNSYLSKKDTKRAYERDLAFWNMQNEYNSPVNQMIRLKEAGLNPNLIYGQISSGNSSSTVHSGIANRRYEDTIDNVSKVMTMRNLNEQNELLKTQNLEALNRTDLQTYDMQLKEKELELKDAELWRFRHDNLILKANNVTPSFAQHSPFSWLGNAVTGSVDWTANRLNDLVKWLQQ